MRFLKFSLIIEISSVWRTDAYLHFLNLPVSILRIQGSAFQIGLSKTEASDGRYRPIRSVSVSDYGAL
jgi:hypothetical protein